MKRPTDEEKNVLQELQDLLIEAIGDGLPPEVKIVQIETAVAERMEKQCRREGDIKGAAMCRSICNANRSILALLIDGATTNMRLTALEEFIGVDKCQADEKENSTVQ